MFDSLTPSALFSTFTQAIKDAFDPSSPLFFWIWGAMAALFLAMVISAVYRAVVGLPIRRMLKAKALSKESALTLTDLKCNSFFYRFLLRPNTLLRKLIFAVDCENQVQNCAKELGKEQENADSEASKKSENAPATDTPSASSAAETNGTSPESNGNSSATEAPTAENASDSASQELRAEAQSGKKVTADTAFYLNEAQLYRIERSFAISKEVLFALPICACVLFGLGLLLFWLLPGTIKPV